MQIFRYKNYAFLKLLSFRILIVLAYQMTAVVVGWHIYEITHDTLSLGLIGLAEVAPYFCCALFAGHAVDHHYSRRLFGGLAATLLCINAVILTVISFGWFVNSSGNNAALWIYGSIAFTGIARAFIAPSYNTLFALILPREEYARASGISSTVIQTGLVLGPALGGLLVGFTSKTTAYAIASLLYLGAIIAMASLRITEPKKPESTTVFSSIAEGLRFVFHSQIVRSALALDMFAVLFGGAVSMLPAFIQDIYHYGPEGLGILRAAPATGAILAGVWLMRHPVHERTGYWLLRAVAAFGFCIIGFALSTHFWVAAVLLLFSGIFDGASVVMRQTILQLATPDNMRGRVSAINGIFIGSSNELGALESGIAARLMGLIPSVIFGGIMTLGVVGITARFAPKLRQLELHHLH
ncbi:putative multidrug-efflux transporterc [mine drainage metagenome]|uniref:Putative multidrug-efflux transporterc n=1 Tax=mine drainage metagenome TaxID=410659 RepID=A0A1J5S9D9_9ZZZZ